jgi:hypothetical protein
VLNSALQLGILDGAVEAGVAGSGGRLHVQCGP